MKTKVEYRIPGIIWVIIIILTFLVGVFIQKNLILQGNTKFLGAINLNNKIQNNSPIVLPTKIYKKFDSKKDLGTIQPLEDENAKVKIVLFSDFECLFCETLAKNVIPNIIQEYVDTGLAVLYFRDYPAHTNSDLMSNAGRCANEQNNFWEFYDRLFALQDKSGIDKDQNGKMSEIAFDIGLDTDQFALCLKDKKYETEIQKDKKDAIEMGIFGVPHMFINDKYVVGVELYEKYKKIIDEELKK